MNRFWGGWVFATSLLLLLGCNSQPESTSPLQNTIQTTGPTQTVLIPSTPVPVPKPTVSPSPSSTPFQKEVHQYTPLPPPTALPYPPATIKFPIVDLWDTPAHEGSPVYRQTQLLLGEKILVLQTLGDWSEIRAVEQPSSKDRLGYPGWVRRGSLAAGWSSAAQWGVVMDPKVDIWSAPDESTGHMMRAFFDTRLALLAQADGWSAVRLPDGRKGWVRSDAIRLTTGLRESYHLEKLILTAQILAGGPYLWGGTAPPTFDCSGFVYRLYHAHGINLARDSQDQAIQGRLIGKSELKPGDLLFYSNRPDRQVTHVALYAGDDQVFDAALNLGLTKRPMHSLLDTRILVQIVRVGEESSDDDAISKFYLYK